MFLREVDHLRPVFLGMKELPLIVLKIPPAGKWSVNRNCFPALVPNAALAQHFVILCFLSGRGFGVIKAVLHRNARKRNLLVAVHSLWHFNTAALVDRRNDIGAMVILIADLSFGLESLGPMDHHRISRAARVGISLEH